METYPSARATRVRPLSPVPRPPPRSALLRSASGLCPPSSFVPRRTLARRMRQGKKKKKNPPPAAYISAAPASSSLVPPGVSPGEGRAAASALLGALRVRACVCVWVCVCEPRTRGRPSCHDTGGMEEVSGWGGPPKPPGLRRLGRGCGPQ